MSTHLHIYIHVPVVNDELILKETLKQVCPYSEIDEEIKCLFSLFDLFLALTFHGSHAISGTLLYNADNIEAD